MNTRDMWENQVELLTRHSQALERRVGELEERLTYFENVVATLLVALRDGGVIMDDEKGEYTFEN